MSAYDDQAKQALSVAGAMCGDCGDEPGDRKCPDCERCLGWYVDALRKAGWAPRAEVIEEVLPVWEAMYEPGNVSDYLIGYANGEAAAKGAAIAWLLSESDTDAARLEWVPQPTGDRHDQWFDLIENHDDGIHTGTGINVRRRVESPRRPVDTTAGEPLSRFSATPAQVDQHLRTILCEDTLLNYQQAIGNKAVEEAAGDIRSETARLKAHGVLEPEKDWAASSAADWIDPALEGGHYPSVLLCGKHDGFGPCPGAPRCTPAAP
ncbi:hypothetical protein [Streptomyces sp. NPDC005407]|uniref:hypothetical protein n=1 Tax=Streptomyces sp. NPDC005407 TaxID=3155340 RepID=UPI0033A7AA1B